MCKRFLSCISLLTLVAMFLVACSQTVQADKILRYKFKQGDKLSYEMKQTMDIKMNVVGQIIDLKMNQTIEMLQDVKAVDSEGVASIVQKISRIQMEVKGPPGSEMKYDSKDNKKPEGLVAQIAPLFKTLTKAEFKVKMAPTGKLVDVQVPDEIFKELEKLPAAAMLQGMFKKESFTQMLRQAATTFPTTQVKKGDTWTNSFSADNPLGKQLVETTYTYAGEETVEGKLLDRIDIVLKMSFGKVENEALPGAKIKIKKQNSRGSMYFDSSRGQMSKSHIDQDMEMEITVGENTITQVLKMKVDVLIKDVK